MSDERYTLDEAKREIQRQECARYGHSWIEARRMCDPVPTAFHCACGKRLDVIETKGETK